MLKDVRFENGRLGCTEAIGMFEKSGKDIAIAVECLLEACEAATSRSGSPYFMAKDGGLAVVETLYHVS